MKSSFLYVVLAIALSACGSKQSAAPAKTLRPAVTQVAGALAGESGVVYSGEIRARHELALGFRTGGKIIERLVETGARVKAGQVLARLDAADAGLQANAAQAQLHLAEAESLRYRELRSKGFVSQSALEVKEAALQAAKSQAGLTHNQSDYTTLRAERDGIVAATLAEAGQVVSAGQAVVRLAQAGELEVAIEIPEGQYTQRHVGDAAEVVVLTAEGEVLAGRLRELSLSADPVSRTYAARVALSVPAGQVALGMTARVRFHSGKKLPSELLIPLSALYQQGKQTAVWIVAADHSVSLRQVVVGAYRDDGVVIVSGLTAGERIVSAGVHRLSAGEKILIIQSDSNNGRAQ